jgi:hypothetical protein
MSGKQTDPPPEEIAAACLQIQSTWTPEERWKRLRVDLRPTYRRCDGVTEDMSPEAYETHISERERIQEGVSDG